MRIVSYDEVPASLDAELALLGLAAFGGASSRADIGVWRSGGRSADYYGVFALEEGHLLGQVVVLRIPYAFRDGSETITGIAGVTTRPDRPRAGIARRLLEEVHRREREAGIRYATLWTNPSWGAHRLYEQLGYHDLYSPPWAYRLGTPAPRRRAGSPTARPARAADLDPIERLHDTWASGRLGFVHRTRGYFRGLVTTRRIDPAVNLITVREHGRLTGYAHLDRSVQRVLCGELVAETPGADRALRQGIERAAQGLPVGFQHSVVGDAPEHFPSPPFARLDRTWWVWMGMRLAEPWTRREAVRRFALDDPRFLCFSGDRF